MAKNTPALPPLYLAVVMFALGLFVATLIHTGSRAGRDTAGARTPDVLFELNGRAYRAEDLPSPQADKWQAWQDRARKWENRLIESAVLHLYFEDIARREGTDPRAVEARLLAVDVTDEQVAAFYTANQARLNAPFGELRESMRAALTRHRQAQARKALIETLVQQGQLKLTLAGH